MVQELRHARAFIAVARTGNFTRAADELNISQPALTVQIRQLEDMFGVLLFDRNKRQVNLTKAGHDVLPTLQRIVDDFDSVVASVNEITSLKRGTVRVAALPSVAASLLPRAIQGFERRHPGITVTVSDVVAETIEDLVKSALVDFGIGPRLCMDKDIHSSDLLRDSMHVFYPMDHPLRLASTITLADVARYPLVLTSRNSSVRNLVERALEREGLEVTVACEANYMSTAMGMVRAGVGLSILPESAVDAAASRGIAHKVIKTPGLSRKIHVLQKKGRSLSPAAAVFLDVLHGTAGRPAATTDDDGDSQAPIGSGDGSRQTRP